MLAATENCTDCFPNLTGNLDTAADSEIRPQRVGLHKRRTKLVLVFGRPNSVCRRTSFVKFAGALDIGNEISDEI